MNRKVWIEATNAEPTVGSVQQKPPTPRPWKIRGYGDSPSGKTIYNVTISLSKAQARKLVDDWQSMGLWE